jgi:DNA (cytosine-5)-methyltransferase 1
MKILELFSGYGSQALALKNLGVDFTSDISEIDKYAIQAYNQLHGETYNWGDITKIDESKLPYYDLITYSSPCFTEDTLVLTENRGFQKITDIQIGEKVVTHDGNYKSVEKVINNGEKKTIKVYGMGIDEIHTTPNHLFYVRVRNHAWDKSSHSSIRTFSNPTWKQAHALKRSDYLGVPVNNKSELPIWDGITFTRSDGRKGRHKNQLSEYLANKNFWWLIGRYIADGWVRTNSGIVLACGKSKFNEMKNKCDSLGIKYHVVEDRTALKFRYVLKELELFVKPFGKYAYGKRIPSFVMNLPINLLESFLDGYMSGDGCFIGGRYKCTSVSRELIYGIAQCVAKVYKQPYSIYKTIRPKKTTIEGRLVSQRDTYQLCFKKNKCIQDKAFYENGFLWFPVNRIEESNIENVYDLTISENHSFTVQGTVVHNCQDFSTAGLNKGGDLGSGTRSSLLWECERIIRAVKPQYLLMENVKNLVGKKHRHNFDRWLETLEYLGYNNYWQVLNAKDYGIPQNRERVFVISIRKDVDTKGYKFPSSVPLQKRLKDMLEPCVDEKYYLSADKVEKLTTQIKEKEISNTIRCGGRSSLDGKHTWDIIAETFIVDDTQGFDGVRCYNNYSPTLRSERSGLKILEPKVIQIGNIVSTGNWDNPQRGRIYSYEGCSPALNCVGGGGLEPKILEENIKNYRIRKLTARECFRLMGVKDEQFDRLSGISNSQLYKLAGNSIVVNVLEAIFRNLFIETNIEKTGQLDLF